MAKVFHITAAFALATISVAPIEAQNAAARPPINMPSAVEKSPAAPKSPESPAQPAAPVDAPPPTPEQMPPSPPRVAFIDGKLTIVAENSTLGDVLNAIKNLTSADVEYPPSAASERIYAYVGPGSPRDVITSLLTGSKFDYVILGGVHDPNSIESVILSVRAAGSASDQQPFSPPSRAAFRPSPPPEIPSESVEEDNNPEPEPAPVPPSPPTPGAQVSPGGQPNNPNQPQVKTPEQLLEELRRMQQQQQQQSAPQQPR